jgi:hypothetical protein
MRLFALSTCAVAILISGTAYAQSPDGNPTVVTFTGTLKSGVSCNTAPSPANATIAATGGLTLTNMTSTVGFIEVNGVATPHAIAPGASASIQLDPGVWNVALQPSCPPGTPAAVAAAITVGAAGASPSPSPSPSASPSPVRSAAPPARTTTPTHSRRPDAHRSRKVVAAALPTTEFTADTRIAADPTTGPIATATHTANYLLVLIAGLCIAGVGAANIRALRQRRAYPYRSGNSMIR